ncbi:Oligopeptide ABC transporter, periplasmic oligopeptide-binding protein OppA (TC 3.A.1.5.1) [hydrothermal vent metagenome]|uniref:Oligopeptide ABC transporter, periplasmic oligopeptide-binding protein OppA (TC 3.A.1.5.1) n=1 Tax=hydrothermal vent metagenome TaxID=652676 RepID=A0A3B0WSI0_9ZZZZ
MKSIKNKLTVATCTLLSQQSGEALAIDNAWEIDSSFLYYSEADDRVSVAKFVANVGGDVSDEDRVTIQLVLDTMSGSTPSGAVRTSGGGNTVSGASGGGGTGVSDPNASALGKFDDTRAASSLSWTHQYENNWSVAYSGAVSVENDYRSFSTAATVNKETAKKDYLFSLGLATTYDEMFRVGAGDTPVPLSQIADNEVAGEGQRETIDIIAGVTKVINRRTVGQVNLAYSVSKGYHTDPYKVFSVVDRASNQPIAGSSFYESRPGDRTRTSITFKLNHQLYPNNDIIHGLYRYYSDDWGVDSHTFDFDYRFNFANTNYLEPRIRLYAQSKADFYQNQFFVDDAGASDPSVNFPKYISADYRLDDFTSITPGIRYGREIGNNGHLRARLEYMYQSFKNSEFDTNKAIIFQIAYSKKF